MSSQAPLTAVCGSSNTPRGPGNSRARTALLAEVPRADRLVYCPDTPLLEGQGHEQATEAASGQRWEWCLELRRT